MSSIEVYHTTRVSTPRKWWYVRKTATGVVSVVNTKPIPSENAYSAFSYSDALLFADVLKTSYNSITAKQTPIGLTSHDGGTNKRNQGAPIAVGAPRRTGGKNAYIDNSNLVVRDLSHIPPRRIKGR